MGDELAFNETTSFSHPNKQGDAHDAKPKPKPLGRNESKDGPPTAVGSRGSGTLDNGFGGTVANGDAAFSRHMLLETNAAANSLDGWTQLRNVVPATEMAKWQSRQRSREQREQLDLVSGTFMGLTMGSMTADNTHQAAAAFCEQHAGQITKDRTDEDDKFNAYNAWVPRANGYFASVMRLRAQEKMLGVTDPAALVQQLVRGIGDASQVAKRMQHAHDNGNNAVTLQVPVVDGTLSQASEETSWAGKHMRTEYLEFQRLLLAMEKDATNHEGDKNSARLAQINQNREFVRNVGKTIDTAMSVIDGAPAAVSTATTTINKVGATLGAAANKRQIMSGMRSTHNPTYIAIDAHGKQVVRNVETGTDRAMEKKPGEAFTHTPTPESEGPTIPTSVGELLGTVVDFAYAGEVKKITFHLEVIKLRCANLQSEIDAKETTHQIQVFQDALNLFAMKCSELQKRVEARRQQYLEFGVQLDNFARGDLGSQKAGLAPSKGGERYASIMTVASSVREVMSLGRGAKEGFESTPELSTWTMGIIDRRERTDDGRKDISFMRMPNDELQRINDMHEQVGVFETSYSRESSQIAPVDAAAQEVLGGLSQAGSGSASGGLY